MTNLVFIGTSPFAAQILTIFQHSIPNLSLVGIVTQPPRPAGRGKKIIACAVHQMASDFFPQIPVIHPIKLKSELVDWLHKVKAEILLVAAYGRILPKNVLDIPSKGAINIHASQLPQWRGAAPVHYTVMSGAKTICNSYILMNEGMDTGPLLGTSKSISTVGKTTGTLLQELAHIASADIVHITKQWIDGKIQPQPQDHINATYATLLDKSHGELDFVLTADKLTYAIFAMNENPGCWFYNKDTGEKIKVFNASVADKSHQSPPGTILSFDRTGLFVACGDNSVLNITTLQRPGGKVITSAQASTAPEKYGKINRSLAIENALRPMPEILYQPSAL